METDAGMRERLIDLVQAIRQETTDFIKSLSDEERAAVGRLDHWEAKDLIGHIATWQHRTVDSIEMAARGENPPNIGEFDHENALIFKSHQDQSWNTVELLLDTAFSRVIQYLQASSEEKLTDPEQDPRRQGIAVWRWIAVNSVFHPLEHLGAYRVRCGQPGAALQMYERRFAQVTALSTTPRWRGNVLYNFALLYVQAGQPEQAITYLRDLLVVRPDLTERVRQHTDFESLRDNAAFQALFAGAAPIAAGGAGQGNLKEKLLSLVQQAYDEETAFASNLTEADRTAAGTPQNWAAKDLLAHVIVWQDRMVNSFQMAARGEPLPTYGPDGEENAAIFAAHHDKSWDDIRRLADDVYLRLARYIQSANESDLTDPARSILKNDRPLWRNIAGTSVIHALLHLAGFYAGHGQRDYATQMQEKIARMLMTLDDTAEWRGNTIYNLACYYALAGLKDPAISNLKEALKLNPNLTEWSTQDTDLASIRQEAAYQALYA